MRRNWIRFDRNELAGSFGDIGTDLPLIVGMIIAAGLDPCSVFVMFGAMQVFTGLVYGLPMPMQPLKAMAVLVITQKLSGNLLYGAGLAIGATMLALSASGALQWLARLVPKPAVRGIQFGLGLSLASLALKSYIPAEGNGGYWLAGACFVIVVILWGNRHVPAALLVIGLGVIWALCLRLTPSHLANGIGFDLPVPYRPTWSDIASGFVLLALPQLPLSLSNSVIATHQTLTDLFPERRISVRRIGLTYGCINLVAPWLSGIPVCHGCGGLAGHYAFGARTGGSVIIYGSMYLVIGLLLSGAFSEVVKVFPQPVLGVVLMFEAVVLMGFIRDQAASKRDLTIALLTGLMAFTLPQGYVVAVVVGSILYYASRRFNLLEH